VEIGAVLGDLLEVMQGGEISHELAQKARSLQLPLICSHFVYVVLRFEALNIKVSRDLHCVHSLLTGFCLICFCYFREGVGSF
jgi:hypothetical protein